MKKIIFTVTNDLTYDRRMLRICTTLATAGFEVCLVGRRFKNSQVVDNTHFTHYRFSLFFNKGKLFYLEYNLRLFFWLLFQRFDIVCGIDLDSILPCYFSAKIQEILRGHKIKIVYDAHEFFTETPEVISRPMVQKTWLMVEKFIIPRVDRAYTVSQSLVDVFEMRYKRRFELIRNFPMRTVLPIHNAENDIKIILYQGALNEGRGIETAIKTMQYVENAVLWLVGEGDLSEVLRGLVADLKLEKKIIFKGFIVPEKLSEITQQATIGLNLLEDKGLSYRYSLANKFSDYIQAEIPQIVTAFPEYQRLNAAFNVALMLENNNVDSFLKALNTLLYDDVFYNTLKENCRKAATVLCWENEEKKLIDVYNSTLAR